MKNKKKILQSLEKRHKRLTEGKSTVKITVNFDWHWDSGNKGNLWIGDANEILSNLQVRLNQKLDKKIERLIKDVDKFVADGGKWKHW